MGARSAIVAVAAVALCSVAPVAAQHFPGDASVRELLQERVDAGGAVGIAVGLLEAGRPNRVIVAGSAGEGARQLDGQTVFEIGSITKAFTGILLADMARRGEVALDHPVERYLPEGVKMPARSGVEITLEDLSTHHSGLPRLPTNMAPADPANPYVDYTAEMMYAFLSGYELPRDIGAEFEYSNLGTGLLGHVLARRLGMTYEDAVRERVLTPLSMTMSGITLTHPMESALAQGHDPAGEVVPLWDVGTLAGAGGLRSNVQDMLRFLAANVGEPTTELERAMRDAHAVRASMADDASIGLNWITRTEGERRIVWHNGGTAGFRTFAGFDPDAATAVVVLTNSGIGADDIGFHLLNPDIPLSPPELPAYARRPEAALRSNVLPRYVGEYELRPGIIATFTLEQGRLMTQLTGQPKFPLFAASETEFFLRVVEADIEFELDDSGNVVAMILRQAGQTIRAPKIR